MRDQAIREQRLQIFEADEAETNAGSAGAFGAFFSRAAEPMLVLNSELVIVSANLAAQAALGLKAAGDDVGFLELLPDDAREPVRSLLRAALNGTALRRPTAVTCRRLDGASFPAEVTAARFGADGELLLGAVIHDRSEADAAVADIRFEQQLYAGLFDLSPIPLREEDFSAIAAWFSRLRTQGIVDLGDFLTSRPGELIDAIGKIKTIRVNRAMLDLMGAESLEQMNQHRRTEMTDEVLESFRREFITLWNGGTSHEAEFVGLNLAGEPFECRLTLSAQAADGQLDLGRVIVAIQDVTQVRAYQRTLESLIAGKDRFVASISHELRTPLAAVLGLSHELHSLWDDFSRDEARELMGIIARGASDLATLVEDLLLAAQIEVGNGVPSVPTDFELYSEVARSVADCLATGDVVALPFMERTEPVWCRADPVRVRQIVRNLVINAGRYGGDSVEVVVSNLPQPTVRVIDDGPGIPAAEWDKIFNPYEQAGESASARGALGLGLSISRQLAEVMAGSLTYQYIESRSVFTLTLPVADSAFTAEGG